MEAVRAPLALNTDYKSLLLRVSLDLATSEGTLDAEIIILDAQGKTLSGEAKVAAQPVSKGHNQVDLQLSGILRPAAASVTIVPRLTLNAGQELRFAAIVLFVDSIAIVGITPDPRKCDLKTSPQDCPVFGGPNSFQVQLAITPATAGELYESYILATHSFLELLGRKALMLTPPPTPGQLNRYNHTISDVQLPDDLGEMALVYRRISPHQSATSAVYKDFTTPAARIASGVANQEYNAADAKLGGILSMADRTIASLRKGAQLMTAAAQVASAIRLEAPPAVREQSKAAASERSASANPTFLAIDSTWQFDPPIPHDGSFSASISLKYSAAELPDDANFVESKLQVVSIDSAGTLHVSPTTLDMTNKVATAQIDGLDPYYSLAVIGPFTQTPVMLATAATGYAVVNTGTQDANLSVTAYTTDGTGTPATAVLKAANLMQSSGSDWVQVWSDQSTVAGISWFDNGSQFAVNPAQAPGQLFVFTDVEYGTGKSTEIDLANTSPFTAQVTIYLFGSDGSLQGTYSATLAPKNTFAGRIESLFPALTPGLSGYVIVSSRETLTAAGFQRTKTLVTGVTAQPITDASPGATVGMRRNWAARVWSRHCTWSTPPRRQPT